MEPLPLPDEITSLLTSSMFVSWITYAIVYLSRRLNRVPSLKGMGSYIASAIVALAIAGFGAMAGWHVVSAPPAAEILAEPFLWARWLAVQAGALMVLANAIYVYLLSNVVKYPDAEAGTTAGLPARHSDAAVFQAQIDDF